MGIWHPVPYLLNDSSGNALWRMHPRGQDVDIGTLPIDFTAATRGFFINELPQVDDLSITIATDVFVLGFPFGISAGGLLPIWKRASVASEPDVDVRGFPFFYVDAATREGMSGSAVIARQMGQYTSSKGGVVMTGGPITRFVGIYSGRIGADDELKAQLGMVWRKAALLETLQSGVPGDFAIRP